MWMLDDREVTPEDLEGHFGFVYLITNLTDGRMYVGKKQLSFSRRRKVKGRVRRVAVESDWRDYFGSCKELAEDVKRLGPDNFRREILHLCRSKTELSYLELMEQVKRGVLLDDRYYNVWISARIRRTGLKGLPR